MAREPEVFFRITISVQIPGGSNITNLRANSKDAAIKYSIDAMTHSNITLPLPTMLCEELIKLRKVIRYEDVEKQLDAGNDVSIYATTGAGSVKITIQEEANINRNDYVIEELPLNNKESCIYLNSEDKVGVFTIEV